MRVPFLFIVIKSILILDICFSLACSFTPFPLSLLKSHSESHISPFICVFSDFALKLAWLLCWTLLLPGTCLRPQVGLIERKIFNVNISYNGTLVIRTFMCPLPLFHLVSKLFPDLFLFVVLNYLECGPSENRQMFLYTCQMFLFAWTKHFQWIVLW